MISLLFCIVIAVIIGAIVLAIVAALLALPPLSSVAPYGKVVYLLVVLLVVLAAIQYCLPGWRMP